MAPTTTIDPHASHHSLLHRLIQNSNTAPTCCSGKKMDATNLVACSAIVIDVDLFAGSKLSASTLFVVSWEYSARTHEEDSRAWHSKGHEPRKSVRFVIVAYIRTPKDPAIKTPNSIFSMIVYKSDKETSHPSKDLNPAPPQPHQLKNASLLRLQRLQRPQEQETPRRSNRRANNKRGPRRPSPDTTCSSTPSAATVWDGELYAPSCAPIYQ